MPATVSEQVSERAGLRRCPGCRAATSGGDRFCRSCGAELDRRVPIAKPLGPPPAPVANRRPRRLRRGLVAVGAAALLGLLAGLVAVVVINGDAHRRAGTADAGGATATVLDPVETLRAHFDLLEQGRFLTAADDLTPALLDNLGGRTVWVSERVADLLIDAQLSAESIDQTDSTATVRVRSLRTQSLASGCTDFTGTYSMVRSGERWLISAADLIENPC